MRIWRYNLYELIDWWIDGLIDGLTDYLIVCVSESLSVCLSFPSHVHVSACMWSKNNYESSLSFHTVGSGDQAQVTKLGIKHPLSQSCSCIKIPRRFKNKFSKKIERSNWNTGSFSDLMWTFRYNSDMEFSLQRTTVSWLLGKRYLVYFKMAMC